MLFSGRMEENKIGKYNEKGYPLLVARTGSLLFMIIVVMFRS
jgi:hypothetical protein